MNATRHVVVALGLTLAILVIAGDQWASRVTAIKPVRIAPRAT